MKRWAIAGSVWRYCLCDPVRTVPDVGFSRVIGVDPAFPGSRKNLDLHLRLAMKLTRVRATNNSLVLCSSS